MYRYVLVADTQAVISEFDVFQRSVFSIDRQKYFSTSPALSSVPVISSPTSRLRCTSPVSFTIRANCPTVSRKWAVVSLSTSLGMMNPLHSEEKLLCILMRSFVVLVGTDSICGSGKDVR